MTTIVWNDGRLVADTRISFLGKNEVGELVVTDTADNAEKIIVPSNMTCFGRKVLAIGCCGNAAIISYLNRKESEGGGELRSDNFFQLCPGDDELTTTLIVVTLGRNYTAQRIGNVMSWVEYSPMICLACGDGVPFIVSYFTKLTPELSVTKAMEVADMTGGNLRIWKVGKEVCTVVPSMKYLDLRCSFATLTYWPRIVFNVLKLAIKYKAIKRKMA